MSLHAWLARHAAERPDAPCLLDALEWAEFESRVRGVAAALQPHRGRVVAVQMPEGPELALTLVGVLVSGAIALPLPATATAYERERALAGLDVACLLTKVPAGPAQPLTPPQDDDVALLVATSGSTGSPKRVALRYGGLAWNASAHADSLGLPDGVRTLVLSPLHHSFPLVGLVLSTLARGGAAGWLEGTFAPKSWQRRCAEAAIDYVAVSPTHLRLLQARLPAGMPLPRVLSVGAAPMTAAELQVASAWARAGGSRLYHTYGLSEAGPRVTTLDPEGIATHPASVGRPLAGISLRVMDGDREAPANCLGEVQLKSPSVMAGYHPEPVALSDGWLATGDLGFLDEDGYLHLRGRAKELIVSGGVNVAPREIEEALLLERRVAEAAVVARPDPLYGEVPHAYVVLRESAAPEELLAHLAGLLSRAKLPHAIVPVAELPRTALGKVDKQKLKEVR
ncbi:MAG TPA: class I adenylate-forming enzyme family protein [Oscillatoriaceae cyanobacterium]